MTRTNILHGREDVSQTLRGMIHDLEGRVIAWKEVIPPLKRKLSYRFYPHFHPYVGKLINRLINESVRGLQAEDTKYSPGVDIKTWQTLPNSTRVKLSDDKGERKVILPDSTPITLPSNTKVFFEETPITLDSSITITLPGYVGATRLGGTQVTLPSDVNATDPDGATILLSSGQGILLPKDTPITLAADTSVFLSDGTEKSLATGTSVELLGGLPLPELYEKIFTTERYKPNKDLVELPYPVKDLDFTSSGAYAVYNWELFFHVPLTIALHLSKNQRFQEAQQWFHYIFDPTDDSNGPTPQRFWKVRPFQTTDVERIEEILVNLSTGDDPQLQEDTIDNIDAWKNAPFRPHLVARYRQTAYMYKTVMAYLDNLIAWGDSLFRQDTGESINEAMQLYVLAANILGPRPQPVPKKRSIRPKTYANLRRDLQEFGIVLVEQEDELSSDRFPLPGDATDGNQLAVLRSLGTALYFCVPRNDKLIGYWDTVADRLFKIRNSLNIQGIFRQLALFEPPIDPALLAKAAAAGVDIGAAISGANQPLPLVRFQFLIQKATEICQEVKSLGNNLLSAIEKEDNEAIALLRAQHECTILSNAETVKYTQWQEAIKSREGLEKSLDNAKQRYTYYERLLGEKEEDIASKISELDPLDTASLEEKNFTASEPKVTLRDIKVDIAQDPVSLGLAKALTGGKILSSYEVLESVLLEYAQISEDVAGVLSAIAAFLHPIPTFGAHAQPMGPGGSAQTGGRDYGKAVEATSKIAETMASRLNFEAKRADRIGSYDRREQEWAFQSNLAAGEITQIFKQLRAAQIREAITEWEWKNHQKQIRLAEETENFLKGEKTSIGGKKHQKTTTQDFYTWMKREVKGLYASVFQFAFDIAKKAERALQHELGDPQLSYLQFGYLAGKEGLLAGEKLYLDLKRMEMTYHDLNQREYELTKHVSLLQVNPLALLELRASGRCTVTLPEELFDMDCPGHYFRRIKSVALTIPCVTGPYTSVNCTLTLQKSSIRKNTLRGDDYARTGPEDNRFSDYFGSLQSIVTSSAQNDSGMFEPNLRDERYLPFEGSGAIGEWQLQLPNNPSEGEPCQFDYSTISDVILHLRYTAREGGSLLKSGAVKNLTTKIGEAQAAGSMRLFSIRHEFPTAWANFKKDEDAELTLEVRAEHFPYWSKDRLREIKKVDLLTQKDRGVSKPQLLAGTVDVVTHNPDGGESIESSTDLTNINITSDKFTLKFKLQIESNSMKDLWLVLTWGEQSE